MSAPDTSMTLRPTGALDIARAEELRRQLLEALAEASRVEVDLADVTAVDLAFFQLLCAAHRSARQHGRQLVLRLHGAHEPLLTTLHDAGISRHIGCRDLGEDACLWRDEG